MPRFSRLGAYDEFTPDLSLADYVVDDMIGQVHVLPRGNYKPGVILQSLVVVARSVFAPGVDVFLFDEEPTLTTGDNLPFAPDASEMNKCVGIVRVDRRHYSMSSADAWVATRKNLEIGIKAKGEFVYAVAVATRAILMPFTANALTFRYHFELERT